MLLPQEWTIEMSSFGVVLDSVMAKLARYDEQIFLQKIFAESFFLGMKPSTRRSEQNDVDEQVCRKANTRMRPAPSGGPLCFLAYLKRQSDPKWCALIDPKLPDDRDSFT